MFLAAMATRESSFYYCDEHFSYIQSDIEKRIFGIMMDRIGENEQLIFTTHNTDMLDLNLPKHSYVFLRKHLEDGIYQVSAVSASDVLKRNTDSLRSAVENDVFASLPQDSLLDELEMEWGNEYVYILCGRTMRAAIDRCIKRNTWEINSWKSKGVQCGTESHP